MCALPIISSSPNELSMTHLMVYNDLRLLGLYFDGEIILDSAINGQDKEIFRVHRTVVSVIPYFDNMFWRRKSSNNDSQIKITPNLQIDRYSLSLIIDWCYTRKIDLSQEDSMTIIKFYKSLKNLINGGSGHGGIEPLLITTLQYFKRHFHRSNILTLRLWVSYEKTLMSLVDNYILEKFPVLIYEKDFRRIGHKELIKSIKGADLSLVDEDDFEKFLKSWIEVDKMKREKHFYPIYNSFKLQKRTSFQDIFKHYRVCNKILEKSSCILKNELDSEENLILIYGGITESNKFLGGGFYVYDRKNTDHINKPAWKTVKIANLPSRAYYGSTLYNHGRSLIIFGGCDGTKYLSSGFSLNLMTKDIQNLAPMSIERCYMGLICVNEYIYALGGNSGRSDFNRLKTVERYDPYLNEWTPVASMPLARSDFGCVTYDGKIYAIGGFNGQEYLNAIDIYNPLINKWRHFTNLPNGILRSGIQCTVISNHMWIMGGYNGKARVNTIYQLNLSKMVWTQLSSNMLRPRSNFGLCIFEKSEEIIILGGCDDGQLVNNVESWKKGTWTIHPKLPKTISGFHAISVKRKNFYYEIKFYDLLRLAPFPIMLEVI